MTNRYTRALKQLKNKSIDEKLELLSEIPTNSSGGLYVDVPGVYTTLPITNPVGEAGTPVNLNQDGDGVEGYTGADTTGLFKEDGTVLTVIPPGDNSYILGPMISMWYAWANYTQIGYVRQSDRKMVNLGRIVGEMSDWDGETGFTGYGQMSVEQAAWYQSQSRQDYRAFYPGPPSNPADQYGRYIGSIISGSRFPDTFRQPSVAHTPGTQRGFDPNDVLSLLLYGFDPFFDNFMNAMTGLEGAAKTLVNYLFNNLPPVVGNNFLGQDYVDNSFADLEIGYNNGKQISVVKDNVIGSGQYPTYNPSTNSIELKFNYDFDTNAQAIAKEPDKYNYEPGLNRRAMNSAAILGGDYGLDSVPVPFAGWAIQAAKTLGGAKQTPGKITVSPERLKELNPKVYDQLIRSGDIPADAINRYSNPDQGEDSPELGKDEIEKMMMKTAPPQARARMNFAKTKSMENFDKLSSRDQKKMMDSAEEQHNRAYKYSTFGVPKAKFEKGYIIDKDPMTGKKRSTPMFSTIPGMSSTLVLGSPGSIAFAGNGRPNLDSVNTVVTNRTGATTRTGATNSTGVTNRTGVTNTVQPKGGETLPAPKNSTEKFADDNGLPRDYKDKLTKANAYFHNNLNGVGYRTLGFNSMDRMNALKKISYEKQGFTKDQIDTIEKKQLVKNTYGASPSYKEPEPESSSTTQWDDPDKYRNKVNVDPKTFQQLYNKKVGNTSQPSSQSTSRSNSFSNIRVGNTSKTSSGVKDYGNVASAQQGPMPTGPSGYKKPGSYDPNKFYNLAPGSLPSPNIPYTGPGRSNVPGTKKYADIAATYGGEAAANQKAVDAWIKKNLIPGRGQNPYRPGTKQLYNPQTGMNLRAHHDPQGKVLTENRKRILRDIKKPVQVKEMPTKFKVKPTGRKNKSVGVDMMKIPDVPKQYKPQINIWGKEDYKANVRASQEKKNEVLELVGAAEHHWTYLTEKKRKEDQEKVNEMMSIEFDKHLELMYENHKIKEERINKAIKAVKGSNDLAPEYPKEPPTQLDPETGMHPKYGKKYKHDKLDPHSAEAMPPTGNPEIDANVKKATDAKAKARKLKILLGKKA